MLKHAADTLVLMMIGVSGLVTFPGGGVALQHDGLETIVYPRYATFNPAAIPVRLNIPIINVDAAIEEVGLTRDGLMENPSSWHTVGWYRLGARPGEKGKAVIAGHLDSTTGPAVFWDMKKLFTGDEIIITDEKGKNWVFMVDRLEEYSTDTIPMDKLFGAIDKAQLILVTCNGEWIDKKGYGERLIVFANMANER